MTYKERGQLIRAKLDSITADMTDEQALDNKVLFNQWNVGVDYVAGNRLLYEDDLYEVLQPHRSQSDWTPDIVPALYKRISIDEYPEWVQPTGAHDAYNKDAKCSHFGKHWMSNIDGNVWEPGIPGVTTWREVE